MTATSSRRLAAVLLSAASALVGFVVGCRPSADTLETRVAAAIEKDETDIALADLTAFDWDDLFVFAPYTPPAEIERVLGFPWAEAGASGLAERDDIALLVFVRGNEVVDAIAFPRATADFSPLASGERTARADARFRLRRAGTDPPRVVRSGD